MGLISTLLKLTGAKFETRGNAPGKSATATGEGMDGQTITSEILQAPGVFAIPPDGVRAVWGPIGNTGRYGLIFGVLNYAIEIDVGGAGGASIYSTTADGGTVKAKIILAPSGKITIESDGNIELNGNSKNFVTYTELNTALQSHTHSAGLLLTGPSPGSPVTGTTGAPVGLDLSAAQTTTIKTGG